LLKPVSERSNLANHVQARHAWTRATMRAHNARVELERLESRMAAMLKQVAALARDLDDDSSDPAGLRRPKGVLRQTQRRLQDQISVICAEEGVWSDDESDSD
jgi:hypothetical protein